MPQSTLRNELLKSLSQEDFELLKASLRHVELAIKTGLEEAGEPIQDVYFPEWGIASVVATMTGNRQIEVGIIGRDGMTGMTVVLGDSTPPNETYIQVASAGSKMPADKLRSAMLKSPTLRSSLLRYANSFLAQASRTALVNGYSKIEERLARWLLMVQDRVDGNKIHLIHAFLATMLGARRPGVTIALNMLEYRGLIQAKRSEITIADRAGLIRLTGGAYGPEEERYLGRPL
jgi:CRP-like cAMP-binding protein